MLFSNKSRLEAEEVKKGETLVLRRFATDNATENPDDSMADALNLALNRKTVQPLAQSAVTIHVRADECSKFQTIPVYEHYLTSRF